MMLHFLSSMKHKIWYCLCCFVFCRRKSYRFITRVHEWTLFHYLRETAVKTHFEKK